MTRGLLPVLVTALAAAACRQTSTAAPATPTATLVVPSTQTGIDISAPECWETYRSDQLGFGFAYPASGGLAAGEGVSLATIDFAADLATNVVEEVISVSRAEGGEECSSPLAEGWAPDERAPESIKVNGVPFLRQTHSGAVVQWAHSRLSAQPSPQTFGM